MLGEALSDGALGSQIRVKNQRSGRTIKARGTGPGQVEVAMGGRGAAASGLSMKKD